MVPAKPRAGKRMKNSLLSKIKTIESIIIVHIEPIETTLAVKVMPFFSL